MPGQSRDRPHPFLWLLAVAGWMAFNGQAFRRIELPGGTALERDTSELDAAATDFAGFQASVTGQLDSVEAAIARLNDRMDRAEGGSTDAGSRVP